MKLHELKSAAGSKKAPKRISRDAGSDLGRDTGKGEKGQNTRSDGGARPGSKGGQVPLYRRLPRRGSTNILAKQYVSINVDRLNMFENGTEMTPEVLLKRRVINKIEDGAKISGNGILEKSLTVKGYKLSKLATEEIEAAGGRVKVIWYAINPV